MSEGPREIRCPYPLPAGWVMECSREPERPSVVEYRAKGPNGQAGHWHTFMLDAAGDAAELSRKSGDT